MSWILFQVYTNSPQVSSVVVKDVIAVETFSGNRKDLCTKAPGSLQAGKGLTEVFVSLPCGSSSIWQVLSWGLMEA